MFGLVLSAGGVLFVCLFFHGRMGYIDPVVIAIHCLYSKDIVYLSFG